ncbi:uncharacterized protein LOC131233939 [Magnolia sinica]|uniref:uncharacterized protein LOC131233939 n=1 Tax=Magnolia sinica TaxID=86752 RepID=UPI00265A3544|nr:uncharacterized protein LOC131233939 [Magnolia sinica]
MATQLTVILLVGLILSVLAINGCPQNDDLLTAIKEMQRADYFTFVTLINMLQDRIPANVTFLMPHDRLLSKVAVPENGVLDFLSQHSIPSPLLFDHLEHFPTGSIIPTRKPGFMLRISNNGRRSFYLNNVRIISPNICMKGSTIRCHGINGVLGTAVPKNNRTIQSPTCFSSSPQIAAAPEAPSQDFPTPPGPLNLTPVVTPPPVDLNPRPQKSGSTALLHGGLFSTIASCLILSLVEFQI